MIYSDSGVRRRILFHHHFSPDGSEEVWVVCLMNEREIQFVIVNDRKMTSYSNTLTDNGEGSSTAFWKQRITALTTWETRPTSTNGKGVCPR
jgi:hypothetical protein